MLILEGPYEAHVMRFSPDSSFLAVGRQSTALEMWPLSSPGQVNAWNIGRLRSIAFSPDGTLAAAGSDTGRIVVWDVEN